MVEDGKQEGDQMSGAEKPSSVRRTVVKGIASAIPMIMTVGSGEVLANSSNLQCIKEPLVEPDRCIGKNDTDIWLRKWKQKDGVTKQCLVYVDESGNITKKKYGGKPVTQSCYNSFLPKK